MKIKLKTKPITTLQSKDNSKINILCDEILNASTKNSKQTYSTNTYINNRIIHNTKKIFINNIINVNPNTENNMNSNCGSYRMMGAEKIQSYKNQIINNIPSRTPCFDYSYLNRSQKNIYQKQVNKPKPLIKNKNENKIKDMHNINKNIIKKK